MDKQMVQFVVCGAKDCNSCFSSSYRLFYTSKYELKCLKWYSLLYELSETSVGNWMKSGNTHMTTESKDDIQTRFTQKRDNCSIVFNLWYIWISWGFQSFLYYKDGKYFGVNLWKNCGKIIYFDKSKRMNPFPCSFTQIFNFLFYTVVTRVHYCRRLCTMLDLNNWFAVFYEDIWAGIFKESMGARDRGGIELSYRPARLHRLPEFIPWNRFLGSINV